MAKSNSVDRVASRPLAVHTPKTLTADIKVRKVVALTLADHTPAQIASIVGISPHKVNAIIKDWLESRIDSQDSETLKAIHLERLGALRQSRWERAVDGQDDKALEALMKVLDQEAKILGLNAPTTTKVTGANGGAIEISVIDKAKEILNKADLTDIIDAEIIDD